MLTEAEFAGHTDLILNGNEGLVSSIIAHDRAQRAEIERLRGDVRVARNELALERESYEQMHDIAIQYRRDSDKWAALAADAIARAEKAEADLARYPTSAADAIICKQQMIEQRARADNYLSAFRREQERAERLSEELYRLKKQSALGAAGATRNQISLEAEVQTWKDNHGLVVSDRDAWRARAEKAEAERDDVMRHVEKMMLRVEAAEARAEKAEHERDLFRGLHREALGCVDRVFQPGGQKEDPVLPDFCRLGESKFEAVVRLAQKYKAHLAAIREWEGADDAHAKKAFARSYRADTRSRLEAAEAALRAIVEEARRG